MDDQATPAGGSASTGAGDLLDAPRRDRRRLLVHMGLRLTATTVGMLAIFVLLPLDDLVSVEPTVMLVGGLVAFVAVLVFQVRAILVDAHPRLRAIEGVGVAIPLIVVVFAAIYASIATADATAFSQPIDKASSVYFTVTVLSTTGFGDIAAVSTTARAMVTVQMLVDLVLIGVVVRLLATAAQRGLERQGRDDEPAPG